MAGSGPARWERRFTADRITMPEWARLRPDRMVYSCIRGGSWQGWAVDRSLAGERQVTFSAVGNQTIRIEPHGDQVLWFEDETGDEVGRWVAQPFAGGAAEPLLEGREPGWDAGLALGGRKALVGRATEAGFEVLLSDRRGGSRVLFQSREQATADALSRDDRWAALSASPDGDAIHPDLVTLDAESGAEVARLRARGRLHLSTAGWAPAGPPCLLVNGDPREHLRPSLWWPLTGETRQLSPGLRGEVEAIDWFPDGKGVLLRQQHRGRDRLFRLELEGDRRAPITVPRGTCPAAAVRPDGRVWFLSTSGARPPLVMEDAGRVVMAPQGPRAPLGHRFQSWQFQTSGGARVHGFLASPRTPGPHPTVLWVHGGPHWLVEDSSAQGSGRQIAALVDHGLLVAAPNYRGSTGYGRSHRDRLVGDPGFPELEDVVAAVQDLVRRGLADPGRVALMGASWGGYITLLGLGRHPELFAAGVARVPVADYPLAFHEESEALRAFDRSLFEGTPESRPDLYRERSPLTYVQRVVAPLLIQAGRNDSRCPLGQIEGYVESLHRLGKQVEFSTYDAGHSAMVVEQELKLMREVLQFLIEKLHLNGRP